MKRFKRLIVPLNLVDADASVIKWAAKVSHLARTSEVNFVHAVEVPDIPQHVKEKYPWLLEPLDEAVFQRMRSLVNLYWDGHPKTELNYRVTQDVSVVLAILRVVVSQESDLVILSRYGQGIDLAIRLARKAPCSIMSIPVDHPVKLDRILVPTDFSAYSAAALDVGLAFAEASGHNELDSVHVFDLGLYSHKVMLPEEELKEMAEQFAEEKHRRYLASQDHRGLSMRPHQVLHNLVYGGVGECARACGSDLIVTGCRGRNTVAALLLGSNAEAMLRYASVPVIAAKAKGSGQKLLEALLQS